MLDIQLLRNNLDGVAERLATRGFTLDKATFQKLESERKLLQTRTQELQASRNGLSRQVGALKGRGEDAAAVMAQVAALKDELDAHEVRLGDLLKELQARRQQIAIVLNEFGGTEGLLTIEDVVEETDAKA